MSEPLSAELEPDGPALPAAHARRFAPRVAVATVSLVALLAATAATPRPDLSGLLLVLGAGLLGLAGVFRPGARGLVGLAALPLPALALTLSAAGAAWAAVLAILLCFGLGRRLAPAAPPVERRSVARRLSDALLAGAVTLIAAALVRWAWGLSLPVSLALLVLSAPLFGATLWALERVQRSVPAFQRGELGPAPRRRDLQAMVWDSAGWGLGLLIAPAVLAAGWARTAPLLGALTALALVAAHARGRVHALLDQRHALERVARIVATPSRRRSDLPREIIRRVVETIDFGWIEVGLFDGAGTLEIHSTDGEGRLRSGKATPTPRPSALPGFHRRRGWAVVERRLSSEDRQLGYVKIWCDPRRLDAGRAELLEALLPQLSATVERVALGDEARLDPLTGLVKRQVYEESLARCFERSRFSGVPLAVAMLDIDLFKGINDTWGHAAGDRVLGEVARVLKDELRRPDSCCCRYGGEEFALLFEDLDGERALAAVDRLRAAVEGLEVDVEGERLDPTLSAGVASVPELVVDDWQSLLELADRALYAAKRAGRNRCLLLAGPERYRTADGAEVGAPRTPPAAPRL